MSSVPPPPPPNVPPPPPPGSGGNIGGASPDAGGALSYGWKKFQENVGPLIVVILIPIAAQIILSLIGQFIGNTFLLLVLSAVSFVIGLMLAIGMFNAALMVTAGQQIDVAKAFSSDRWGEWILFSFLFGLCVGIGSLLCGIGALIFLAFFGFAPFYFLDQRRGVGDSFSASLEKTRSMSGLPLAIGLVVLVGFLGVIVCFIGLLVTEPIAYVGVAWLYRVTNNQAVAA